jgi:hypothetical protein
VRDLGLTVRDLGLTVRDLGLTVRDLGLTVRDLGLTVRDRQMPLLRALMSDNRSDNDLRRLCSATNYPVWFSDNYLDQLKNS